ncbi:MAG: ArsA family ATPase [Spirochaetes bacterium]|nr:MAG: ArsA family ATPase [Spirochaetota bacterium]
MKILFFVGKGGVGKSTLSALYAVKLARRGKKVFLNSIDPAHNLHDIFCINLSSTPREIIPGLAAVETDLNIWVKKYLKETERELKSVYKYQEAFNLHKYFKTLKYAPGIEEYAVFLALEDTVKESKTEDIDFLIFDTPPTALTLKFFALPSVSLIWLKELKIFRQTILDKKEIITKIKSGTRGGLIEKDPVLKRIDTLIARYEEFFSVLKAPHISSVFVVLNPFKLSRSESLLIQQELTNLGINIPYVILNKYTGDDEFMHSLKKEFKDSIIGIMETQNGEIEGVETLDSLELPVGIEQL